MISPCILKDGVDQKVPGTLPWQLCCRGRQALASCGNTPAHTEPPSARRKACRHAQFRRLGVSPTRRKPGSAASPRNGGPDDVRTTRDTWRVITGEIGGGGGAAATHPRAAPRPRPEALAAGRRLEPAAAGPGAARGDLGHRLRQAHPASRPRHFTRAGRKTSRPGPGSTRRPRRR